MVEGWVLSATFTALATSAYASMLIQGTFELCSGLGVSCPI